MEPGLHFIGYLLAFFLAFLYFPNLVFKFGAEASIDLGRRRDSGELEEFFSAVIPCILLNTFTYLLLWFAKARGCPWRAVPDYDVLVLLFSDDKGAAARMMLKDPSRRDAMFWYVVILLGIAFYNGTVYGYAVKRNVLQRSLADRVPTLQPGRWKAASWLQWFVRAAWWACVELGCYVEVVVWHRIYHEEIVQLVPYAIQKPAVFVRLRGGRLYYGQFERYDKAVSGEIDSITILDVHRYCYDEIDRCLSEGRPPISQFQGPLRISIGDVTDIHTVPLGHFANIKRSYAQKMIRSLGRDLLTAFAGREKVSVIDIYRQHAGGTLLTIERYRQALRYLELEHFVTVEPTTINGAPQRSPADAAVVTFPRRVAAQFDEYFHREHLDLTPPSTERPLDSAER